MLICTLVVYEVLFVQILQQSLMETSCCSTFVFCLLLSQDQCNTPSECRPSALTICPSKTWLSSDAVLILVHRSSFVILTASCQKRCRPGWLHIVRNTSVEVFLCRNTDLIGTTPVQSTLHLFGLLDWNIFAITTQGYFISCRHVTKHCII